MMKQSQIPALHVAYWLLLLLQTLLVGLGTGVLGTQFDWHLFLTIVLPVKSLQVGCSALFFYANYLILVPYTLKKGNIIYYLTSIFCVLLLFTPLYYLMEQRIYPRIGWKSYELDLDFRSALMVTIGANFLNIFLGLLLSYLIDWRRMRAEKAIAEQEGLRSELAFLKSQVNPHYLFNTLNDIYALSQQQSSQAPQALLKLSELLRYMLRESNDSLVPLSNEIDYLHNVITLQQIGQKGNAYINFKINGQLKGQQIAPLILINFVENAFKHGIFNKPEKPIEIRINLENNSLAFYLHNTISSSVKDKTGGVGLVNVRRRLELIYPKRHTLVVGTDGNDFIVNLKIILND